MVLLDGARIGLHRVMAYIPAYPEWRYSATDFGWFAPKNYALQTRTYEQNQGVAKNPKNLLTGVLIVPVIGSNEGGVER
jgi:hypothetical protein